MIYIFNLLKVKLKKYCYNFTTIVFIKNSMTFSFINSFSKNHKIYSLQLKFCNKNI